jgi:multidrug efflux pump subunit AcrB
MMSHLDRSDGWLTRLDAIQKILMMIVRRVELNFAQLSGKVFATFPLGVRDVESVAVDPYPAFGADPLGSHLDVGISAGDGHGDASRIFQFEAVMLRGVPNGVGWRKLATAFHLQRPSVVEIQSPMRDIAVMADPVKKLSATRVVVQAPALVRELGAGQPRSIAAWLGPTKLFKTMAFATLTNIVSYLPFLLLPGDTGKFLYSLPIVISCSLLAALLVSMTFVPLISSFLLQSTIETPIEERRKHGFTGWYFRTAKKAIEHRKLCLAGSLVLLIAGGVVFSRLKPQFFPKDLQYFSYIDVWLPEDTPTSATSAVAQQVESITRRVADEYGKSHPEHGHPKDVLRSMTTFVGGGGPRFWSSATPEDRQTNYAQVILRTKDNHDTTPLLALLQPELDKEIPGAIVDTRTLETGKPVGIPVQVRISGEDLPRLRAEAEQLKQIFRDIPIAARVRDDWGEPSAREVVQVDADRANLAHVTNADVSDSIGAALHGTTAGVLRDGNKQVPIVGRMQMEERSQLSDLRSLYVFSRQDSPPVPLDQVATTALSPVTPKIRRFDQYRTITVQCWPTQGHLPSEVIALAMPKLEAFHKQLPDGFIFRFAGEQKEQVSGFADLTTVLLICISAIYLALLAQFKHAFKPLIVFAAIPYGVVGAIFSLAIMGQPLDSWHSLESSASLV